MERFNAELRDLRMPENRAAVEFSQVLLAYSVRRMSCQGAAHCVPRIKAETGDSTQNECQTQ
jgi:hypothetical protein